MMRNEPNLLNVTSFVLFTCSVTGVAHAGSFQPTPAAAYSGAWGLEVTIDSTCAAPVDVTVGPGPVEGDIQACRSITSTEVEIVGAGADLTAGETIEIQERLKVTALTPLTGAK